MSDTDQELTPAEKAKRTRQENVDATPVGVTIDASASTSEPQSESATTVGSADGDEATAQLRIVGMPYQKSFLLTDADGAEYEVTDAEGGVAIPKRLVGRIIRAAAAVGVGVVPVVFEPEPEIAD